MTGRCEHCDGEIPSSDDHRSVRREYCSDECRRAAQDARRLSARGACAYEPCSAAFTPSHGKRYCSRACKEKARQQRHGWPKRPRPAGARHCARCERELPAGQQSKYCGHGCAQASARRHGCEARARYGQRPALDLTADFLGEDNGSPRLRREYRTALAGDPCVYCGEPAEAIDHIDPRAAGGEDDWSNYAPACHSCNSAKADKPLLAHLGSRGPRRDVEASYAEYARWTGLDPATPIEHMGVLKAHRPSQRRGGHLASKGASKGAMARSLSAKNGPASRGRSE